MRAFGCTNPVPALSLASRYVALSGAIRTLRTMPMRYRRHPDDERLRIISVEGYRIIYRVDPDTGDNRTAGDVSALAVLGAGEP